MLSPWWTPVVKPIEVSLLSNFDFDLSVFVEFGNAGGECTGEAIFLKDFYEEVVLE